jgi:transposase
LRRWVRDAEREAGERRGPTRPDTEPLQALKRETRELQRANEILRKASALFATAELDAW